VNPSVSIEAGEVYGWTKSDHPAFVAPMIRGIEKLGAEAPAEASETLTSIIVSMVAI
jgi:hypothetical protein